MAKQSSQAAPPPIPQFRDVADRSYITQQNMVYSSNKTLTIELERTGFLAGFFGIVEFAFDVAAGTTAATAFRFGIPSPERIIKNIRVRNNNNYIYASYWQPQVIVIGLGTNDFSTKLNEGERWKTRAELQQDYVHKYVEFVKSLHTNNPTAQFILMTSDQAEGEIATQVGKVVANLKNDGLKKVDSIIFTGLDYKGCHWHPSVNDDKLLAELVIDYLKENKVW